MSSQDVGIDVTIDMSETLKACESIREMLSSLFAEHDLSRYSYTRQVRIAHGEIAHSHPVLTLNTRVSDRATLLSLYLHEQMHWYVTWYSWVHKEDWAAIWAVLQARYPDVPVTFPLGARTRDSSYLHLIVNWLEIDAASEFLGREKAVELAAVNFAYSGLYKLVIENWEALSELYKKHALLPIRLATVMTEHDLRIAARMNEAAIDRP